MEANDVKLLVVEDDPNLGDLLNEYLQAKGFNSHLERDGNKGLEAFKEDVYDLCIFDVMMPEKDGFTLAKDVRKMRPEVPVIFLTAKSMKEDKVEGFKLGADDYITKPFSMEELLMRVNAILRRTLKERDHHKQEDFQIGKFMFNSRLQELVLDDKVTKLTSKENDLLRMLALNINGIMDRTQALNSIWGDDSYYNSRSMDVYITKLRKYLKDDADLEIVNVHGKGFKLIVKSA
ncbi:MAG: response regulator transcription factor [Flavobacteriales bacterium]|nr:response regulator transcription factor [Flavobacteriales bacterium]